MNWMDSSAIHDNRSLDGCTKRQIADLSFIGQVGSEVIMGCRGDLILDHLQRSFRVSIQQVLDRLIPGSHFIDMVESEVTEGCHQIPVIKANVVCLPGLRLCIAEPGQVFAEMRIAGHRE